MPITTLSPDIDPTLSPLAAKVLTDAEGRALYLDAGEDERPNDEHASMTASDAQEGQA